MRSLCFAFVTLLWLVGFLILEGGHKEPWTTSWIKRVYWQDGCWVWAEIRWGLAHMGMHTHTGIHMHMCAPTVCHREITSVLRISSIWLTKNLSTSWISSSMRAQMWEIHSRGAGERFLNFIDVFWLFDVLWSKWSPNWELIFFQKSTCKLIVRTQNLFLYKQCYIASLFPGLLLNAFFFFNLSVLRKVAINQVY